MPTVKEHYTNHLGPVYIWMVGGVEAAIKRGAAEIDAINVQAIEKGIAIDLGSGFGTHAIPLANRGFSVIAIDTCTELLDALQRSRGTLPIQTIEDDLLEFRSHLTTEAQIILCMGDTLTHLRDPESVQKLFSEASEVLKTGGRFILTFRDYSEALTGEQRFIPVRSDGRRILTCFLEYADSYVTVHDILHELDTSGWHLRVSSYRKLRFSPDWVCDVLDSSGFDVQREPGMGGMVRIVARRIK